MKKHLWIFVFSLVIFAAANAPAAVLRYENFMRDGKPVLVPSVQEYQSGFEVAEDFVLPEKLTVALPAGEELVIENLSAVLKRFGSTAVKVEKDAHCSFVIDDSDQVPAHPQGYKLTIDKSGITVSSRSKTGLFYGSLTLCNILRNIPEAKIPGAKIKDWPDFDRRGYFFTIRNMPPARIPELKRTIDMFSKLKINWLMLELAESFPFENNPLTKRTNAFTKAQIEDIIEFCRRRHIEIIATLQVWSHAQWMTFHPDWDKMKEGKPDRRWNSQPCPFSEAAHRLTEMAIDEHIKLFKPKSLFIMMDEFVLGPHNCCEKCSKEDTLKLFTNIVKTYQKRVLDQGVIPVVCQDSFLNNHRWKVGDELRKALDPRTEVVWWSYRDRLPAETIKNFKDFTVIGHALNGKPFNLYNMAKLIKSQGGKDCTMVYWYYSGGGMFMNLKSETPDSLGGFVNGADYMWKLSDTKYQNIGYDGVLEMMRLLRPEMAVAKHGIAPAEPISLEPTVNSELSGSGKFPRFTSDAELNELKHTLAAMPERFRLVTSPGGKYYGIRLRGSTLNKKDRVAVAVGIDGRKMDSVLCLATTSRSHDQRGYAAGTVYGRKRNTYPVVVTLRYLYEDGTFADSKLKYRWDITDWNRPFGGIGMRFAVRGLDSDSNYYSFGVVEFKNPRPKKMVKQLIINSRGVDGIEPVILAVSARGLNKPMPVSRIKVTPKVIAKRVGVENADTRSMLKAVVDFENGMGETIVTAPKKVLEKMTSEIIDDPTAPVPGKVLKVTIPAGDYKGRSNDGGYIRVSIDLPFTLRKQATAIGVDLKFIHKGTGFFFANDYIIDRVSKVADPNAYYRLYRLNVNPVWTREMIPFWMRVRAEKPMRNITDTRYRRISFFFKHIDAPVEIYVDNIGFSEIDYSLTPVWRRGGEAEAI